MLGAKPAGYHDWQIFLANGAQRVTHISYVGRYVGLVQSRIKNMSLRTIGVKLVPMAGIQFGRIVSYSLTIHIWELIVTSEVGRKMILLGHPISYVIYYQLQGR